MPTQEELNAELDYYHSWGSGRDEFKKDRDTFHGAYQQGYDQQLQSRQGHMDYIDMLQSSARGEAPSVAQGQLRQATDANISNAYSMAASSRGGSYALAMRTAQQQAAQANQAAAAQAATLRAQEIHAAQMALGNAWAQQRAQDMGVMGSQLDAYMGVQQGDLQARMQRADLRNQQNISQAQIDQQNKDSKRRFIGGLISTAGQVIGSLPGMGGGGGGGGGGAAAGGGGAGA